MTVSDRDDRGDRDEANGRTPVRRLATYGLVTLLALGVVVVNAVDFARIDARTIMLWRALDVVAEDESALLRIAPARRRYALFLAIADAAPEAVVSGPCRLGVPSFRHRMFGLAGVVRSRVDRSLDSDALLAGVDLSDHVVFEQEIDIDAVVAVASYGTPGVHLLVLCPTGGESPEVVIVDARLVTEPPLEPR